MAMYFNGRKLTSKGVVPIMTSDNQDGFEATSDSILYEPYHAFDDNEYSMYTSMTHSYVSGIGNTYLQIKLNEPTKIIMYSIQKSTGGAPVDFTFQGSDDGVNFDILDTQTNQPTVERQIDHYNINPQKSYLYYRLNTTKSSNTSNAGGQGYVRIANVYLFANILYFNGKQLDPYESEIYLNGEKTW
jgi:hypothetical protein